MSRLRLFSTLPALLACTALAAAADHHVDITAGSDLTGDGSAANPWRTIAHALAVAPSPPPGQTSRLWLAPGVHDAAAGEVFPLGVRDRFELLTESGVGTTLIDGGRQGAIELFDLAEGVTLRGLRIRSDSVAVHVWNDAGGTPHDRLIDVELFDSYIGLGGYDGPSGRLRLSLTRTQVHGCQFGLELHSESEGLELRLRNSRCDENHVAAFLAADGFAQRSSLRADIEACRFVGNTATGLAVAASGRGELELDARGTSFALNYRGLDVFTPSVSDMHSSWRVAFEGCTLTENDIGIRSVAAIGFAPREVRVHNSIVWGNELDVESDAAAPNVQVDFSDVSTGDFVDLGGNLDADPLFAGELSGDWALRAGSPCIDAGDPADGLDADGSRLDLGARTYDPTHVPASELVCVTSPNSVGPGARLVPEGTSLHGRNDLVLAVEGCPPSRPGQFLFGTLPRQAPFLDGVGCIGGTVVRLPSQPLDAAGTAARAFDLEAPGGSLPPVPIGATLWFQFLYRDVVPSGNGANLSDALRVRFDG